ELKALMQEKEEKVKEVSVVATAVVVATATEAVDSSTPDVAPPAAEVPANEATPTALEIKPTAAVSEKVVLTAEATAPADLPATPNANAAPEADAGHKSPVIGTNPSAAASPKRSRLGGFIQEMTLVVAQLLDMPFSWIP